MPGVIATRSTRWRRLPALGTSWPPGSAPSARQRTGTPLRDPAGLLGEEGAGDRPGPVADRKSTRLNSSHGYISYAVFCLKKKKNLSNNNSHLINAYDS